MTQRENFLSPAGAPLLDKESTQLRFPQISSW